MADRCVVDTVIDGNIVLEQSDDRIRVFFESDESYGVTIARSGPRTYNCPLGTRRRAAITAEIGGRQITLDVGRGWVIKRSYRVVANFDGRCVSLRPNNLESATFINGRPHEIEKGFGELTAHADGRIEVLWCLPTKVRSRTVEPPVPHRDELLVGYALAWAFGTGALSLTAILMGLVEALPW